MKIIIKEVVTKHDVFNVATDLLRKSKAPSVQVQPSKQEKPTTSTEPAKTEPTSKEPETQQPKLVYKQVKDTSTFRQWLAEAENKIVDFWNKERQKYIGQNVRQKRPSAPPRRQNENLIFEQQELSLEKWVESNKGEIKKYENLIFVILPYKESFNVNFIIPNPDPKIKIFGPSLKKYFILPKTNPNIMKPAIYIGNKKIQQGELGQIKANIKESLFTRFKQLANII